MAIRDWPSFQRPREKLLQEGAAKLSDEELLAIFLGTGTKGKSAIDVARSLLARFGGLDRLLFATIEDLEGIVGLGQAKKALLLAIMESAKRALASEMRRNSCLNSPNAVKDYLRLKIGFESREIFTVIFLDTAMQVLALEELFLGTLNEAAVYPREIAEKALRCHAAQVILAHNHPSGSMEPSQADRQITKTIREALWLLEIKVLDHLIITRHGYFSFAEHGLI